MNKFEKEVQEKGYLPSAAFPGGYPIYYLSFANEVSCADCATKEPGSIEAHDIYWEGAPMYCEGCNAEIKSAYGDPEEDEADGE